METRLMTIMPDGQVFSASDNLVKTTRLMQLASSFAEVEWTEEPEVKPNDTCYCAEQGMPEHEQFCMKRWKIHVTLCEPSPKLDALEDIIEEHGGRPLVVAAQSAQLINLAANRLKKSGVRYGRIVGDVSEYDRQQVIDRFNRDQIQVVLMTIDAGGTGVDGLQHSDTLVVLQRSWKMVANVQLEARVDRIGSEKHDSIHIIDVVTRGTIEETKLFPRMQEKFHRLEQIHRDTARFLEAGLQPPEMFTLQREEAAIMASDMGAA
jgi:SNF2 family DNA or RNA helicase